ncbi:precorrin-3B synthase [Pseudonocardia endophytica]|uniref:Precorrin-3B synthase n=1 Tax=Pseudonocardia endophytica TaxID=401976 RepID=A0A4R1HK96_PSEEN|nr:precorrin-3B synthase [Pseudonocardia endophytica]TCK21343.1 precorrin-3B synthase [Pseudonocardia endophytica]
MPQPARGRSDTCPGVSSLHPAEDGYLARIRVPGGVLSRQGMDAVAECSTTFGDGRIHLTSRANLQIRGLRSTDASGVAGCLSGAGLLPSVAHERVRNILASPLSGLVGGTADVRGTAGELDRALCASASLAALPGRFLFAIDDGRGDVAAEDPDVCWRAVDPYRGRLEIGGIATGIVIDREDVADRLARVAELFLQVREHVAPGAWRAAELPDAARHLGAALTGADVPPPGADRPVAAAAGAPPAIPGPVGRLVRDDGGTALGFLPLLGELTAVQLRRIAELVPQVVVTPWRTLVLADAPRDVVRHLDSLGLVTDPDDPAVGLSCCTGRPGCAKALSDVRTDALNLLAARPGQRRRAHLSGCARRCGHPRTAHTDVVADGDGYHVDGTRVPSDGLAAALWRTV